MRIIIIILLAILFSTNYYFGQDLIQNGGFEEYGIDENDGSLMYCNWKKICGIPCDNPNYLPFSMWVEKNIKDSINENGSRRGMKMDFEITNYRKKIEDSRPYEGEYCWTPSWEGMSLRTLLQSKLKEPLKKDSFYRISFMYKILYEGFKLNLIENLMKNKIGVLFTNVDLDEPKYANSLRSLSIDFPLDFYINIKNIEWNKWKSFNADFKANKEYNFIIVGNNNNLLNVEYVMIPYKYVRYMIDNISLKKISKSEAKYFYKPIVSDQLKLEVYDNSEQIKALVKRPAFQNPKLKTYYDHIDKAETYVIDKKYKEALTEYCNAFDYKVPFFRDFMNARTLITKFKIADSLLLRKFLITSQKYTPNKISVKDRVEYFQKIDTIFKTSYLDFFKTDTSMQNISFAGKIDSTLIRKIFSISGTDQASRKNRSGIKNADESNYESVLKLYKEYKEISELTIGQWPMENLRIMFLHFSRYDDKKWIDLLQKEVMKGNFDNRTFASLIDSYIENNIEADLTKSYYLTNIGYAHHTKYMIPSIDRKQIAETNKRRAEIYLEPVESQQRKQLYNYRNGFEDFNLYFFFSYDPMYPDSTITEAEALEKEKEFIEDLQQKYPKIEIYDRNKTNYDIDFK